VQTLKALDEYIEVLVMEVHLLLPSAEELLDLGSEK
jgi:hypothetical protein